MLELKTKKIIMEISPSTDMFNRLETVKKKTTKKMLRIVQTEPQTNEWKQKG